MRLRNSSAHEFGSVAQNQQFGSGMPAAREAQSIWRQSVIEERLGVVRRFRERLAAENTGIAARHAGDRAAREILVSEVLPLLDACRFLERSAKRILRRRRLGRRGRPAWLAGTQAEIVREPWGVVLIIAPSNYPLFLPGVQVLQALVAGNSVLLKPGKGGSAAALEVTGMLEQSGLPPYVVQLLDESAESARVAIAHHPDKIIFTGAAETGLKIIEQVSNSAIPTTLELSGCDAVYIREDADLDMAARAVAFGLTLNSGRTCIAPKRVYVNRAMATEFEGRLAVHLANSPSVVLPKEITAALAGGVRKALAEGSHLFSGKIGEDGVRGPLVLGGLHSESPLLRETFFAPVLGLVTVAGDIEAVCCINDNPYGLAASVFSRDIRAARRLGAELRVGTVVINDMIAPTADPRLPFGGCKLSGYGVTRGAEGLLEMTRPKTCIARTRNSHPHFAPARSTDARLFSSYIHFAHAGGGWGAKLRALTQLLGAIRDYAKSARTTPKT